MIKLAFCFAAAVLGVVVVSLLVGVGGWGPTHTYEATVTRLYVDVQRGKSHYMVGTDCGVFEVANGWLLDVWNADELYSKLVIGRRYRLVTKGRQWTNWLLQEYAYITKIGVLPPAVLQSPG